MSNFVTGSGNKAAEVAYLGVSPRLWGQGVGEALLRAIERRLRADGYARAALSV